MTAAARLRSTLQATPQQVEYRRQLYALVPAIEGVAYLTLVQVEQFCALAGIRVCEIMGLSDPATRDAFGSYYGAAIQRGPQREPFLMPYKKTPAYRQAKRQYDEAERFLIRPYRHQNITQA